VNFYDDFGGWPMLFSLIGIAIAFDLFCFWMRWFPL